METKLINVLFFFLCFMFTCNTKILTNRNNNNLRSLHLKRNLNNSNIISSNNTYPSNKQNLNSSYNSILPKNNNTTHINNRYFTEKYNSLFIQTINNKSNGFINFQLKEVNESFSIGINQNSFTLVSKKIAHLSFGENRSVISGNHTNINSINSYDTVMYNKVSQWRLISEDNFLNNEKTTGWSFNKTSQCKHLFLLGGHCKLGKKEIIKSLNNLPQHTEVKIEANFHFIGKWDSNTAFLRIDHKKDNDKYIWTETCKNREKKSKMDSLCTYETCKINSIINVSLHHTKKYLNLIYVHG